MKVYIQKGNNEVETTIEALDKTKPKNESIDVINELIKIKLSSKLNSGSIDIVVECDDF